ncbi:hypothetical protein CBL_09012 [Carabus blaptoides fortunei]
MSVTSFSEMETVQVQHEDAFWSDDACKLLIDKYKENKILVEQRKIKTMKKMWEIIQDKLQSFGYTFTSQQCENKWKSLERAYKNKLENKRKTGRARKGCPFERELAEIFARRHSVFPVCTLGSADVRESPAELFEISTPESDTNSASEEISETPTKRRKKSNELQEFHKAILKQKIIAQEQRQELLEVMKKRNEIFERLLEK